MTDAIETEFKLALPDAAAMERLLALVLRPGVRAPERCRQENHFLDTADDALRHARCVLRLRSEDGRWELALKGPAHATANAALQARAEEQRPLDAALAEAARKGTRSPVELLAESRPESDLVRRARDLLGGRPLVERAGFVNERLRLEPGLLVAPWGEPWHLVLELDRTVFPGGRVDHELEVELPDVKRAPEVLAALRGLFREADLAWTPARSKAERLFQSLDER